MLTLDLLRQLTQLSLLAHLTPRCVATSVHPRLMFDEVVLRQALMAQAEGDERAAFDIAKVTVGQS